MTEFRSDAHSFGVLLDEKPLLSHSPSAPLFATGETAPDVRLEDGVWTLPAPSAAEKPLVRVAYDRAHRVVRFGSPRRWVSFSTEERADGAALKLEGSSRKFGRLTLTLAAEPSTAFFGGGLVGDLRGRRAVLWASDRRESASDALKAAVGRAAESAAFPLPFFYGEDGFFIAFKHAGGMAVDFTHRSHLRFELWGLPEEIVVGRAEGPRGAAARVSALLPERPVPPRWSLEGITVGADGGEEELLRRLDRASRSGLRPSAVYLRDWAGRKADGSPFRGYSPSAALYPHLSEISERLRARGIRTLARVTPQLDPDSTAYHEAARLGLLLLDRGGLPLLHNVDGMCAELDLSNPDARSWAAEKLSSAVRSCGFAALSAEGAAFLPPSAVCASGSGQELHNRWAKLWLDVCREAAKPCSAAVFSADAPSLSAVGEVRGAPSAWRLGEGVSSCVEAALGQATVGAGLCYADARAGLLASPPELRSLQFVRFSELAAFLPHFRLPALGEGDLLVDPTDYQLVAKMARLHNLLAPYFAVLVKEYAAGGLPPVRAPKTVCPELDCPRGEIFVGDDLVFAPVGSVAENAVEVALPDGGWVHLLGGGDYTGGTHRVETLPGNPAAFYRRDSEHAAFFRALRERLEP